MKITAWQLFGRNFKLNDEVIVFGNGDGFAWGKLVGILERGFRLQRPGYVVGNFIPWSRIRFMCHDGFPVRELFGADGSATIEQEANAKDVLRSAMAAEYPSIVFGDPFLIESVYGVLHNPGNEGPEWDCEDGEECLELVAVDGARGMLWDLPTVFHAS